MSAAKNDPYSLAAAIDDLIAGLAPMHPDVRFLAQVIASARLAQRAAYDRMALRADPVALRLMRLAAEIERIADPDGYPHGFENPPTPFRRP
jgi:hypothetical protein